MPKGLTPERLEQMRDAYIDVSRPLEEAARDIGLHYSTLSFYARKHGWPERGVVKGRLRLQIAEKAQALADEIVMDALTLYDARTDRSEDELAEIIRCLARRERPAAIAERLGLSRTGVSYIGRSLGLVDDRTALKVNRPVVRRVLRALKAVQNNCAAPDGKTQVIVEMVRQEAEREGLL